MLNNSNMKNNGKNIENDEDYDGRDNGNINDDFIDDGDNDHE